MSEFAATQSKREGRPSERAVRLALDLERRGSLEGHYVWSEMIQQALDNAFIEGHARGVREEHMDMNYIPTKPNVNSYYFKRQN